VNDVYFACQKCHVMVEAGYRWAYWKLEQTGYVRRRAAVSAQSVALAVSYWSPPDEPASTWLKQRILPAVRSFLTDHGEHPLTYGDAEEIAGPDPVALWDWLEIGDTADATPRYLVDGLGMRSWDEVLDWSKGVDPKPWWWSEPELRDSARRKFEELAGAAQPGVTGYGAAGRR
jgi:hypothetical protein